MSELKPCPFCGGEADYTQILGNYGRVYCFTCDGGIREGRSKDGVIHNWNNRPIEDALTARIAELEQDLSNKETEYTDLWDDALALQSRIAELEDFINQLIEEGDALESQAYVAWRKYGMLDFPAAETWCALVKDWKEREG